MLRWPRQPDYVIRRAVSSIPTDPGEVIDMGCDHALVLPLGSFGGVEWSNRPTTGVNFVALPVAFPLPGKFRWRSIASGTGSVDLIGWKLSEDEARDFAAFAALVAASAAVSGTSPLTPASVGKLTTINTGAGGSTTLHTVPAGQLFDPCYLDGFLSVFTAVATVQITQNGNIIDQFTTAAVGSLFRSRGPFFLAAGETLAINVSAAGAGTLLVTSQAIQVDA